MTIKTPESLEEAKTILEGREIDFGAHASISWLIREVEKLQSEKAELSFANGALKAKIDKLEGRC